MALEIKHSSFGQLSEMSDTLVIEISNHLIAFCEFQTNKTSPHYVCEYAIDLESVGTLSEHFINTIKHFQFSKKNYKAVYVNYFSKQFTLCPTAFYHIENNRTLLEFNTGSVLDQVVLVDEMNTDIKLIYAIEEAFKSTLDVFFPHHQLRHSTTVLSKLLLTSDELVKEHIIVSVHSTYIEIVVKQNHQLVFANQFSITTTEDVLYYVLFVLEQYYFNPLTTNITIVGNMEMTSHLMVSLKKYIKNIHVGIGNKQINWEHVKGMPQHFNYTLLNRLFCE